MAYSYLQLDTRSVKRQLTTCLNPRTFPSLSRFPSLLHSVISASVQPHNMKSIRKWSDSSTYIQCDTINWAAIPHLNPRTSLFHFPSVIHSNIKLSNTTQELNPKTYSNSLTHICNLTLDLSRSDELTLPSLLHSLVLS